MGLGRAVMRSDVCWENIAILPFFNVYLFLRERERESERESRGGAERERERKTQNLKQAPGSELSALSLTWDSNP